MADQLLTLDAVTVGYERHVVLRDIQFSLQRSSFTGLLGANGSGKSTLIKTVLGIIPPLAGKVTFHTVGGAAPVLGYVPQRETLDPIYLISSFEVVLMGTYGRVGPGRFVNRSERDWAMECLTRTDAASLRDKRFSQLSGGQKQRVLIARALATRPDLLLLDEPTAGIDAAATQSIMDLLKEIHEREKLTIVMVNHDLPAVRRYAQNVIWLHQGKVLQGAVSELLTPEQIEKILDLELG
jgi:manganese/zinc/iron transport system ATP- binding protein